MFQNLRQGQQFYILHKGDSPKCEIGNVLNVTNPVPKFPNNFQFPQSQEMVVDVKVKTDNGTFDFQKLPANLAIADFSGMGNNVVVSTNKDAINAEIEAMQQSSRDALAKVDYHNSVIVACDEMLKALNPQFAKEKQQEQEIGQLKDEISGLKNSLNEVLGLMKQNLSSPQTNSSNSKKS